MISPKMILELQPLAPRRSGAPDPKGPPTLELVPAGPAGAAALAAAAEINILPLSTTRVAPPAPTEKPDRYMAEAAHQYAEGHLDQPLWDRAFAQADGDKEAAVAGYLQARAIALKLLDREKRSEKQRVAARKRNEEPDTATERDGIGVEVAPKNGRAGIDAGFRNGIIVGAILLTAAIAGLVAYWLIFSKSTPSVVTAPPVAISGARAPAIAAAGSDGTAAVSRRPIGATPELLKKIQDLRDAGSWNVLVLYLVEWTRKEPTNAEAWDQLRAGYTTLKQYEDALAAAKKAQELMPEDSKAWRNLALAYADAGDPVAALKAFEQAVARDDHDAESLTRIGILNAQLSQLPEAGRAFDRALAINPGDHVVQCLRTGIAPLSSAPKDTYATAKQVKAIDAKCRGG
jgi:tetratricopeptide (TPR) repeat protein